MRALVIPRHGGPEVLALQDRPDLVPGPGEVLIRVRASGVNFADLMAMGADGHLPPHVDAAIPAERGAEAHRRLHERKNKGKVVLTWP